MDSTKNPLCVHACNLYSIKVLFFHAQSFEYIHESACILKNKGRSGRQKLPVSEKSAFAYCSHTASKNMQTSSQNTKENSKTSEIF